MITIKIVNRVLKENGINAELVKGDGYYWFDGPDVEFAFTTSVMVCRINDLSLESWLYEAKVAVESSKSNHRE